MFVMNEHDICRMYPVQISGSVLANLNRSFAQSFLAKVTFFKQTTTTLVPRFSGRLYSHPLSRQLL